ncbi:MAG: GC-type dockerin domain-anchored protein [Phycisphaerales bacterium]
MTHTRSRSVIAAVAGTTVAAVAFAQPVNDSLSSPIVISVPAQVAGTTVNATNDFGLTGSCGNSANAKDVWYRFNCTTSATVEFSTCSGTSFNSVLQVFTINPNTGNMQTEVACNDNACGTQSRVNFNAVAGTSYMVRVAGNGTTASGTFLLTSSLPTPRINGPDVTVGDCIDISQYGTGTVWVANSAGTSTLSGVRSYAIGTTSWNIGNIPVEWQASNQLHPVIGQQMYRYKGGKFEQIGISWLKHGFLSTNSNDFPEMGTCDVPAAGGAELGVNCSDTYGSSLNGGRSYLGPRFDVNPTTGVFTYPWTSVVGTYSNTDQIARRLVVLDSDVVPAQNTGAEYYGDTVYITQDDAQWNNGRDNYSSRKLVSSSVASSPTFSAATVRRTTALELWAMEKTGAGDTGINLSYLDYPERVMNVVNKWTPWTSSSPHATMLPSAQWTTFASTIQGRFLAASRVSQNADTTWNYDYMVMNINSNRAGASFGVRLPSGAAVSNIEFKAPLYHSGERTLNNPWLNNAGANGQMVFTVDPTTRQYTVPGMASAVTFNPNALMWGTMYSFRFTTGAAPVQGNARLNLFRPAPDATGFQGSSLAVADLKVPAVCLADIGGVGGFATPDGVLDNNDFIAFIDAFFNSNMLLADVGVAGGVAGADNALDNNDFIAFINGFFNGCI